MTLKTELYLKEVVEIDPEKNSSQSHLPQTQTQFLKSVVLVAYEKTLFRQQCAMRIARSDPHLIDYAKLFLSQKYTLIFIITQSF